MHSVVVVHSFSESAISARAKGAVHGLLLLKRPLQQARALTVDESFSLETTALDGKPEHVACISGYLMFCLCTQCKV